MSGLTLLGKYIQLSGSYLIFNPSNAFFIGDTSLTEKNGWLAFADIISPNPEP